MSRHSYRGLTSLRVASMTSVVLSVPLFKDSAAKKSGIIASSPSSSSSLSGLCCGLSAASPSSCWTTSSFYSYTHIHTHTQSPNGQYSKTTWVRCYRDSNPILDFNVSRDDGGGSRNSNVCKALVRSSPPEYQHSFLQARCPFCRPTNSVKAVQINDYACNWLLFNLLNFQRSAWVGWVCHGSP